MSRASTRPFPDAVCWDAYHRELVLNPIALDVTPAVFRATHHAIPLRWEGGVFGTYVPVTEQEFLQDFLAPSHSHVFDVVVGDSGTGKSHLIRWLDDEIARRVGVDAIQRRVVSIPRSSANLADVLRRILKGFEGDATKRLLQEINGHRPLSDEEAQGRVLDELAYSLERLAPCADEFNEYLRTCLPEYLRDQSVRAALSRGEDGIVRRLARHVQGKRETVERASLKWTPDDLRIEVRDALRAAEGAKALAAELREDDEGRAAAAALLNGQQGDALASLLRFRRGDLKRALEEIRAELSERGEELILLLEDLSVTEGVDGELVEALQVRTNDTGQKLCVLRSIIGITHEDDARIRSNIRGRVTRTIRFDSQLGAGASDPEAELALFASKYLNASRLTTTELDQWMTSSDAGPPPSACDDCPNRTSCHLAFGQVGGYGLYPFTSLTLSRLYQQVAGAHDGGANRAFNPRLLIRRVLDTVLDEAENAVPRRTFPSQILVDGFRLHGVRMETQRRLGASAARILPALELYSPEPEVAEPLVPQRIVEALAIDPPAWARATADAPPVASPAPTPERQAPSAQVDEYESWFRKETPADGAVNAWRQMVHEVVVGGIDWDAESLGHLFPRFRRARIHFEGQATSTPDPILHIPRTLESALTLRFLAARRANPSDPMVDEASVVTARLEIEKWTREMLASLRSAPGHQVEAAVLGAAIRVLALGVFMGGRRPETEEALLDEVFRLRVGADAEGRNPSWRAVQRVFAERGERVQASLKERLSCRKGRHVGGFIDSTPVLAALHGALAGDALVLAPPDPKQWEPFDEVAVLVQKASQHLAQAVDLELSEVKEWRAQVRDLLGEDDAGEVLGVVIEALEASATIGRVSRDLEEAKLVRGQAPMCVRAVDTAVAASGTVERLAALGSVDRTQMSRLTKCLSDLRTWLETADRAIVEDPRWRGAGETSDASGEAIAASLNELEKSLSTLNGPETGND